MLLGFAADRPDDERPAEGSPGRSSPTPWSTPPPHSPGGSSRFVLPEASELGFAALERRIRAVLLELDPRTADENRTMANRTMAEAGADVRT